MNNITSNNFKRHSYFPGGVLKTESKEVKKKRSSFYNDYLEKATQAKKEVGLSINKPVLKLSFLTPQEALPVLHAHETTGSAIKENIKGKAANDLTNDEIKIIASRYNLGPDIALNAIVTEYGDKIYNNKDEILKALS